MSTATMEAPKQKESVKGTRPVKIGSIVHYWQSLDAPPHAAIVIHAAGSLPGSISLTVFSPWGESNYQRDIPFSDEPKLGCWTWPA